MVGDRERAGRGNRRSIEEDRKEMIIKKRHAGSARYEILT